MHGNLTPKWSGPHTVVKTTKYTVHLRGDDGEIYKGVSYDLLKKSYPDNSAGDEADAARADAPEPNVSNNSKEAPPDYNATSTRAGRWNSKNNGKAHRSPEATKKSAAKNQRRPTNVIKKTKRQEPVTKVSGSTPRKPKCPGVDACKLKFPGKRVKVPKDFGTIISVRARHGCGEDRAYGDAFRNIGEWRHFGEGMRYPRARRRPHMVPGYC